MDRDMETVNIIYASNDGYTGRLATSLYSLSDSNRNIPRMDIYTLSVRMNEVYLERLVDVAGVFRRGLRVTELGNLRKRFDYEVDTRGFDIGTMGRLFAPKVLPDCVRKVLYLDCNTIADENIRPLYEVEPGSHLMGMVTESTVYKKMKDSTGMERDEPYYNSGVLPVDLGAWRNQDVLRQLLELYRNHEGSLSACDQNTINKTLGGRIMPLPVRYNYFTNYRYFKYGTLAPVCGAYRSVGENEYRQAGKALVIIYYLGDKRPWTVGDHNHFRRLYEYYLDKTPWKDTPKQGGKRLYMQMWWVFNRVSLTCPAFWLWIGHRLGIRLVDSRRRQKTFGSGK